MFHFITVSGEFFILFKLKIYNILKANSEDQDQMPHIAASDLGLHVSHMSQRKYANACKRL